MLENKYNLEELIKNKYKIFIESKAETITECRAQGL